MGENYLELSNTIDLFDSRNSPLAGKRLLVANWCIVVVNNEPERCNKVACRAKSFSTGARSVTQSVLSTPDATLTPNCTKYTFWH